MSETTGGRKAALWEELTQARAALLDAVAALSADDLAQPAGHERSWTAKDLIGHVAYAEAGMLPMIQRPLAGEAHQIPDDFDLDRWNDSRVRRARTQSVPELLARLEASRREALALLDMLDDADLDRPTAHPRAPETTLAGIFTIVARHERGHAEELRTLRALRDSRGR